MSTISAKTNERIKNEQIFNLFLRMKRSKTEEENSIIKYMVFKKENFFLKIDEIKNKNKGKKARNKSLKFLKKEFEKIQKIYNEFNKSEESYFVFDEERKSMCFLKSSKDYNILKYFAFNIFHNDIFVHIETEYGNKVCHCTISSKDIGLLKNLKIKEKLGDEWNFIGYEIKNKIDIKTTLKKLKEKLVFLILVSMAV